MGKTGLDRDTDGLQEALMEAPDLEQFLSENESNFNSSSVQTLLERLFLKTRLSKAELARRSGVSAVYLHQMFAGKRTPSRDRLICLGVGLSASLPELQDLLRRSGCAELYPRDRRDAIIIYGVTRGRTLQEINDALFQNSENTLI